MSVPILGLAQSFTYVDPNDASCPKSNRPTVDVLAAPKVVTKTVPVRTRVSGQIDVRCGFTEGSYTLTIASSDPKATIEPKTMLVNFGRLVGKGVFSVTFATEGQQSLAVTITSNMGSPTLNGRFVGVNDVLDVQPKP